ncbi:hypothetical protein Bca52824_017037 [Brassica carinata]|uniref:Uncharacterized protein n=1 Tax=Brassica carinata TaxID=52824 RepID=A0A8X8AVT7_BRACI|nr:hypothetical protein Bca52824_017037 [Brassica carinata]
MMKRPMKEVYGSDDAEGFRKGKKETEEHYRLILRLDNEHRLSETEWNQASSKVNTIAVQVELLHDIIKSKEKFDFIAELEKLTAEKIEAEAILGDVKVKVLDWSKLGEKWMLDE